MTRPTLPRWLVGVLLLAACQPRADAVGETVHAERLKVKVLAEHPHDPRAFTQGLLWADGVLYESTGQYRASTLRKVDPASGAVLERRDLDPGLFGEGLARVGETLIQLTWQAGLAIVYDFRTLELLDYRTYRGEGWGLAWDGERLVMSNGTSRLVFRDPETFAELGAVDVTLGGQPLDRLNELEVVGGELYANVWMDERIVRIDPANGAVTAVIDASGLLTPEEGLRADVLNGIAWDPESKTFWITGKYWPKTFQVTFVPESP